MAPNPNRDARSKEKWIAIEKKYNERRPLDWSMYPCTLPSPYPHTCDPMYCQNILDEGDFFAERTTCDVLEMDIDGRMFSKFGLHDEELRNYIKVIRE